MHPISHFLRAPLQELRRQPLNRNFKLTAPETCLAEDVRASAVLFLALAGSEVCQKQMCPLRVSRNEPDFQVPVHIFQRKALKTQSSCLLNVRMLSTVISVCFFLRWGFGFACGTLEYSSLTHSPAGSDLAVFSST